jgi:hypothetical protein
MGMWKRLERRTGKLGGGGGGGVGEEEEVEERNIEEEGRG